MITIPSFSKLIVLIGIIVLVWYAFRFLGEVERTRKRAAREAAAAAAGHRSRAQAGRAQAGRDGRGGLPQVEDTVKCRACGAYVPVRSPTRCGRADCPY